jgi:hypothetical protein
MRLEIVAGVGPISRRVSLAGVLALVALGVMAFYASGAQAGDYHVYSCRTPSGQSAPADGWSASVAAGGAFDDYATNSCASGGALVAALGDQTLHAANVDKVTWAFEPPALETLVSATLWRAGYLHGQTGENATYQFWLAGPSETSVFDECIYSQNCQQQGNLEQPLSAENRILVPNKNLGARIYVNTSCGVIAGQYCNQNAGDPNGYAAAVYLYAADLVLEQSAGPTASNVSGELASSPAVQGTSDLAFSATDPGAGVYAANFSVDGQVVQSTVLDDNGGRCRNVGQTADGLAAFLYVQPCAASVNVDVPFDTTKLSDGEHHLVVSVIDAAGNSAPVIDREITVANPPPPCAPGAAAGTSSSPQATLAASWKGTAKDRLTSPYGRAQTISGRLTGPGGAPIAGASIDLTALPSYVGAGAVSMAAPRTGADGRFNVRLPGGISSRTLCFAYHIPGGSPSAVTRTLSLSVRAGIALSISPRTTSVGRRIFFRGRLLGGPIPAGGKQLVLEARSAGSPWLEFDVIRTDAGGHFKANYRFKFPGPANYQFRVLSEPESDYPFAAGTSNIVRVYER